MTKQKKNISGWIISNMQEFLLKTMFFIIALGITNLAQAEELSFGFEEKKKNHDFKTLKKLAPDADVSRKEIERHLNEVRNKVIAESTKANMGNNYTEPLSVSSNPTKTTDELNKTNINNAQTNLSSHPSIISMDVLDKDSTQKKNPKAILTTTVNPISNSK
ncbi:MAG: hypothetical protein LBE20_01905 [Deltaproteobacteria bacterium]|jgi:polynucleotide 5'-kinase involved in rRNA processing|nr:hypothetical protein [Deltaproteobacteria bacterium]